MNNPNSAHPRQKRHTILANIVICILILFAGGSVFGWLSTFKQDPEAREKVNKVYNVEVFDVESADLQEILTGFGTAAADREVVISAQVSGEVIETFPRLEVGEKVSPASHLLDSNGVSRRDDGDLLVKIDPQTYQERVQQAENRLKESEADQRRLVQEEKNNDRLLKKVQQDYLLAEKEYQRTVELRKQSSVTQSQLVRAELDLNRYQDAVLQYLNQESLFPVLKEQNANRIVSSQTDLRLANIDLERTRILPPFPGSVSEVMVELGQYVRPGEPLLRLTDLSEVEIPVSLTLTDYAKIDSLLVADVKVPVELAVNETAPVRWIGFVERIAPIADEKTRTVNVYVHVDNDQQEVPLLPGTFVHARITGPVLKEVKPIPREAIVSAGRIFVIGSDSLITEKTIEVDNNLQSLAFVTSGVEPGDQVVLTNLDVIYDGARSKIQSHRSLAHELKQQRVERVRRLQDEKQRPQADASDPTADDPKD